MGRSISPMEEEPVAGSDPRAAPRLIVPMSLQLVIPRRVALQQSSPPLHQPSVILKEKRKFEKEEPLNCMCANSKLSQQKGSPQETVAELCQNPLIHPRCHNPGRGPVRPGPQRYGNVVGGKAHKKTTDATEKRTICRPLHELLCSSGIPSDSGDASSA